MWVGVSSVVNMVGWSVVKTALPSVKERTCWHDNIK